MCAHSRSPWAVGSSPSVAALSPLQLSTSTFCASGLLSPVPVLPSSLSYCGLQCLSVLHLHGQHSRIHTRPGDSKQGPCEVTTASAYKLCTKSVGKESAQAWGSVSSFFFFFYSCKMKVLVSKPCSKLEIGKRNYFWQAYCKSKK